MKQREKLIEVGEAFRIEGELISYNKIKSGHINTTYKVLYRNGDYEKGYLVQMINDYVFRYPIEMMDNIHYVTKHLVDKRYEDKDFLAMSIQEKRRRRLHFHHTAGGDNYYVIRNDDVREFWRLSNFIDGSISFDSCDDPKALEMCGKAFGHFMAELCDFDVDQLFEVIPDFHNTRKRFKKFFAEVERDTYGRCDGVRKEIEEYSKYYEFGCSLCKMIDKQEIPIRVTHNDTKINNVLFDEVTLEPLCVIDLDTVMPGLAAYDFGDTIRFAANTAVEDEKDLSKVSLNLELYEAFAKSYIAETKAFLSEKEIDSLVLGSPIMTLECGLRFLTDYITGDKYFHIDYPKQNLDRARCQLRLFEDMMDKMDDMIAIVNRQK